LGGADVRLSVLLHVIRRVRLCLCQRHLLAMR
jgi:hypothetical protein